MVTNRGAIFIGSGYLFRMMTNYNFCNTVHSKEWFYVYFYIGENKL